MKSALSNLGADVIVVPAQDLSPGFDMILRGIPATFFFDTVTADTLAKVDGVGQVAPRIYLVTLGADCCSAPVQLIAINPGDSITLQWLRGNGQKPPGKDEIIVGSGIEGSIGDSLTFYGHQFIIAGRLGPTGTDVSVFLRREDASAMAADSAKNAAAPLVMPEGNVSAILVKVSNDRYRGHSCPRNPQPGAGYHGYHSRPGSQRRSPTSWHRSPGRWLSQPYSPSLSPSRCLPWSWRWQRMNAAMSSKFSGRRGHRGGRFS